MCAQGVNSERSQMSNYAPSTNECADSQDSQPNDRKRILFGPVPWQEKRISEWRSEVPISPSERQPLDEVPISPSERKPLVDYDYKEQTIRDWVKAVAQAQSAFHPHSDL